MREKLVPAFFVIADGKKFGPYRSRHEEKISNLLHLRGIKVEHVFVPPEVLQPPPKKRRKKPENLSLLDGLDYRPTTRREAL